MISAVDSTAYQSWYNIELVDSVARASRTFEAQDIFGPISSIPTLDYIASASTATVDWQGSVVVVVLLSIYCYLLFRYRSEIRVSFKSAFSLKDTLFVFESLTLNFSHFLTLTRVVLSVSLAVMTAIFADVWQSLWVVGMLSVAVWLIFKLAAAARQILLNFDYNPDRWHSIKAITGLNHAVVAIILPPVVIMLCSLPNHLWIGVAVVGMSVLYHFLRLLNYFRLSGFSILQWILYLCAVELIPFTLLWSGWKWICFLI